MARKSAGSGDFNMAEEIRNLLAADHSLTGKDVLNQLRKKFPKQPINEGSCQVAFANARKKLGLSTVRKKRPTGNAGRAKTNRTWTASPRLASPQNADAAVPGIELLLAAKNLLQHCGGDAVMATAALKQVASLQVQ